MPSIAWTVPALDGLRAIDGWLTNEASPSYALRTLASISFRTKFLEGFARRRRPLKDGTRILRVPDTPYLFRYRVTDGSTQFLRIHHEREDWFVDP